MVNFFCVFVSLYKMQQRLLKYPVVYIKTIWFVYFNVFNSGKIVKFLFCLIKPNCGYFRRMCFLCCFTKCSIFFTNSKRLLSLNFFEFEASWMILPLKTALAASQSMTLVQKGPHPLPATQDFHVQLIVIDTNTSMIRS